MSEPRDMEAPVTRRELHEALEIWGGALQSNIHELDEKFEQKFEYLDKKIDFVAVQITHDIIAQVKALLHVLEDKMRVELRGIEDALGTRLGAFLEHYSDVPERLGRLEAKVFAPSPKRKRRTAR